MRAEFLAQTADVHVDRTIERAEPAVQRASRQIILGDHLAGVFDQYAQHVEFRAGQFDRIAVEAHAARGRLQFDIATTQRHLFDRTWLRSEEHTSELQTLMRTSYAGFCLKKKNIKKLT